MHTDALQLYSLSKSALEQNKIQSAIDACRTLNSQFPDFFEGWWLAGCIHLRLKKPQAGLISTSKALSIKPNQPHILIQRIEFLSLLEEYHEAKEVLKILAEQKIDDTNLHADIAIMLSAEEMHESAIQHYLDALKKAPKDPLLHYNLAAAYRFVGDIRKCEESLNKCIRINYLDADAQSMRSSLRKQSKKDNHIEELSKALGDPKISESAKSGICYAIAKEFDDIDSIEQSFYYLKQGSNTRRTSMTYDVKNDEEIMDSIARVFDSKSFTQPAVIRSGIQPIFIIGLPRTGTTLLERIMDCHSQIKSRGELDIFGIEMAKELSSHNSHSNLSALDMINLSNTMNLDTLADRYLRKASPEDFSGRYFIDKLPFNFLYAGLIHLTFPKAKIINLTRHPLASCMAMYRQQFRDIYPFSYDLKDLGRYFVAYSRLMSHWHSVMPGVIHSVSYEQVVMDTEREIRQVLEFCQLGWEPQCLQFHENKAPSTTASATQVRQPVYSRSLDRWKKYTSYLDELTTILVKAGIDVQ